MNFKSMILRYRDLSTDLGGTFSEHQKKIKEKGFVWWGWWSKQGETVPTAAFAEILKWIQKSGALPIYLFDTGQLRLYEAKLEDIKWDNSASPTTSPSSAFTPKYYGKTKKLAWFKISAMKEKALDESCTKKWSYYQVDELFEAKRSVYQDFYGKQISSFKELKNQDRTIWFFRDFKNNDKVHEILVYSKSSRLVWVSDPHFSNEHHNFPLKQTPSKSNLSETLRRDLEEQDIKSIAGVILSGDLTWKAEKAEFDHVRAFLRDVSSWATLSPERILVCPGNHDIAFSKQSWATGSAVSVAQPKATKNYRDFYQKVFNIPSNDHICSGRKFLIGGGQLVEIASLNSSTLQQSPQAFQGQGFLGREQLDFVAKEMGWTQTGKSGPRGFRIAMLHHHVVPVIYRQEPKYGNFPSVIYDAGDFCRWIVEHEVDLVIHGHMHQATCVKEVRSNDLRQDSKKWHEFVIISLGSTGVKIDHTSDSRNSYGILEFGRESVTIRVRQISASGNLADGDKSVFSVTISYRR